MNAVKRALWMHDGRADKEEGFLQAALDHFSVSEPRLLIGAVKTDDARKRIAAFARRVCEMSSAGSKAANGILDAAASETLTAVRAALKRDAGSDRLPLILSGGLVAPGSLMAERIAHLAASEARVSGVMPIDIKPSRICAALALKEAGLDEASERLLRGEGDTV